MTFDEAVIKHLLEQTILTSLIKNKLFPDVIPTEIKLPGVSYSLISSNEDIVMTGHNAEMESIYQFDIKAITKSEAVTISEVIKSIFRTLKKSNDFNGYKLSLVKVLDRLPSDYSNNTYIEKIEIMFFHDYIST